MSGSVLSLVLPDGQGVLELLRVPEGAFADPGVADLPREGGLAYAFSPPRRVGFWTLGFEHALDQVFIAATGRIVQVFEGREPGDATQLGPASDVALVLELQAGMARRAGLLPGASVGEADPIDAEGERLLDPARDPGFIVIVQSDRAGWFLASELRSRGYRIAHVHHTHHLEEVGEDEFDLELVYGDDLDEVLEPLRELGPSLILAGSELGVNPADYLAEALQLPGNGTALSIARRDKAGMIEALKAAGIPVMRQLRTHSWKRIARWMERRGLPEIVVKPVRSAGTDRVTRCRSPKEIRRAVAAIVGGVNRLGLAEVEAVAQERLFGTEVYLNSVSRAGRHAVTEIWLETKRQASGDPSAPFAYDTFQLLPGDDVLAGYLTRWLFKVLDALGVVWGPAHTELILTERGPRLIDFGARLDGVLLPALNEECIGRSPVQLTADAYLDPAAWEAWAAAPYRLRQHATMVVVDNPCAGVLRDDAGLKETTRLPTFHALRPRWEVGEEVPATRDAFSYHAIVTLRDADPARVAEDYRAIRALEAGHLLLDVTPPERGERWLVRAPEIEADPRATDAWGEALAAFGWTTVRDEASGLLARLHPELDGLLMWVPRQNYANGALELLALERLRIAHDARRVIVELLPGTHIAPLAGEPLVLDRLGPATEEALIALGLSPTLHAQAPPALELAPAPEPRESEVEAPRASDVEVTPLAALDPAAIEAVFRELGLGGAARWPAALGASFAEGALAVVRRGARVRGAALGILFEGVMHVPVATARRSADLLALAQALGAAYTAPLVAPGTGVSRLSGGALVELPPALRWRRPRWAEHLTDLDSLHDAVGRLPEPSPHRRDDVTERFAAREHPLATWGGAAIGQAMGRMPMSSRGAMIFREVPGDAPHGVVPHAPRIDLASLALLGRKKELMWVGWEPPPLGGEVVDADGNLHRLRWDDPGRALAEAAALGLFPVHARWTHRKTYVLDLAGDEEEVLGRLEARRRTLIRAALREERLAIRIVPARALTHADWRRLDALDEAFIDAEPAHADMPHPRRAARGLVLGLGAETVAVLAEDDEGLCSYILCLLHDRVAWSMIGTTHPRAAAHNPQLVMRWHLIRHARAAGCDLMDLYGAWDERFPDEHPTWQGFSRHKAHLHACPVYYPPTLALFV